MLRWPRYACKARVSWPLLASAYPQACLSMCGCDHTRETSGAEGPAALLDAWRLGDLNGKPEGLAFTAQGRAIVGLGTLAVARRFHFRDERSLLELSDGPDHLADEHSGRRVLREKIRRAGRDERDAETFQVIARSIDSRKAHGGRWWIFKSKRCCDAQNERRLCGALGVQHGCRR